MVLIKVENFLGKFFKRESQEERSKRAFDALHTKLPNLKFKIRVKNKVAYFYELSPSTKSEIFLNKKEILKELKDALKDMAPSEISFLRP